jgi:hypothetical protein
MQLMNDVQLAHAQVISQSVQAESTPQAKIETQVTNNTSAEVKQPIQEKPVAHTPVQAPSAPSQPVAQNGQTVAKKYAEPNTLGEKIGGHDTKRLSDNIKLPVTDINSAIGINEKFQFINQLFQGDTNKYTQFIQQLNKCQSAADARTTLSEMADANHWENVPSAKQFIDVVERKFSA